MCNSDQLTRIITCVADITDISTDEIMSSSKRPDVVDARYLAIYVMLKYGCRAYRVAQFMCMTERNVYHVQERFDDRKTYGDPMLECYYSQVLKALK